EWHLAPPAHPGLASLPPPRPDQRALLDTHASLCASLAHGDSATRRLGNTATGVLAGVPHQADRCLRRHPMTPPHFLEPFFRPARCALPGVDGGEQPPNTNGMVLA